MRGQAYGNATSLAKLAATATPNTHTAHVVPLISASPHAPVPMYARDCLSR